VVYFYNIGKTNSNAFWGFYAAEGSARGVGSRMEYEALQYAFHDLNLHKLNCEVIATNDKVLRLHKKFGFLQEGLFRDFHFNGHEHVDVVRMGILCEEWKLKQPEMLER